MPDTIFPTVCADCSEPMDHEEVLDSLENHDAPLCVFCLPIRRQENYDELRSKELERELC